MNEFHEYSSEEIIEYADGQGGIWGRVNFRIFKLEQLLDALIHGSQYDEQIKDDILDRVFKTQVGDALHLGHRHLQHPRTTWWSRLNGNEEALEELQQECDLEETPSGAVLIGSKEVWVHYGNGEIYLNSTYERVL